MTCVTVDSRRLSTVTRASRFQFQPKAKRKQPLGSDFDAKFDFLASAQDYNQVAWNDLAKYIKRKASHKTDDKIKQALSELKSSEVEREADEEEASDLSLSDDELQHDKVKTKDRKTKRKGGEEAERFFEDVVCGDENVSFYEMNLSRPLLKAITTMKFVHPTPVQASTIPVALAGEFFYLCVNSHIQSPNLALTCGNNLSSFLFCNIHSSI